MSVDRWGLNPSADLEFAVREVHSKAARKVVGFYPGHPLAVSTWSAAEFVGLGRLLSEEFDVVLIGEADTLGTPCKFDLRGKATIGETAAILFGCCLFVGVESLALHLAESQGLPIVRLFSNEQPPSIDKLISLRLDSLLRVDMVMNAVHRLAYQEAPTDL